MRRKALMMTSALAVVGALAVGPASAADKLSVGLGGYMEQWIGVTDRDDAADGVIDVQSDSEIFFTGSLQSDMGLKFGVNVQLEGNANNKSVIDESFAYVSGEFGRIEIGARDAIHARTHYGISDVGILLNAGDSQKWIPGAYLDTNGWIADNKNVIYISPRVQGVQVGVSYGSDGGNEYGGLASSNDHEVAAVGANLVQAVGDASVKLSAGFRTAGTTGTEVMLKSGMNTDTVTVGEYAANTAAIEAYATAMAAGSGSAGDLQALRDAAALAEADNAAAFDTMASRSDDDTFTNFGLAIGMGAFGLHVAYAERDMGAYMVAKRPIAVHDGSMWDHDGDDTTAMVADSPENNNPDNDIARTVLVNDGSKEWDVLGVSVTYSDGPMAFSLGHMMHETAAGTERNATMFSVKYALAPGVDWKSSLLSAKDTTRSAAKTADAEGTALVTGIDISF